MRRRDFLSGGFCTLAGSLLGAESVQKVTPLRERLCLFTDHLDDSGYSYADVARMLKPLQIAGPDLTVRGGGLVPPERVVEELPKAAAAFREQGMSIPMLSTSLTSDRDPAAKPILTTMSKLGIRYYKLGYFHYHDLTRWELELNSQRQDLVGLLELGRPYHVYAGLHNHAGAGIGGAIWDGWEFLKPLDPQEVGFYFDPSHASIEGAKHTWKLNLQRISSRVTMIALKDYVWEKSSSGWQTRWSPLGEGLMNWKEFFQMLSRIPFAGPMSLHIEYNPGGSTRPERIDNALAAAQRDFAFVRRFLDEFFPK